MAQAPQLLDAYGRPVDPTSLRHEYAAPQITGVRSVWAETVASGLTPRRLASLLQRAAEGDHHDYLTLAEEIEERDGHYRSVLATRKLAVSGLEPAVEAASDATRDVELADAVRELTRDPGFSELVDDLLDGLGKGFSAVEVNWHVAGNRWRPSYAWRDPRFFQWDWETRSELRIRDQADAWNGLVLPPYKFIVHVPRLKTGLPIRGGLARPAAWGYLFKSFSIKDWAAFLEVYGFPMRLGRYGEGATEEEIGKLVNAVVNLGSDAAAVIHKSMEIEFQNAVGSGQGNAQLFEKAAEFWDKTLSKIVLGQTATTEGTPGKLGNEQAQAEVREDILKADAAQISATLNRDLVKPFVDLNFGPPERYPRLYLHVPEEEDLTLLTDSLAKLVPLGLRVEQSVIRDKLGLPDPAAGAELLAPSTAPSLPPASNGSASNRQFARLVAHAVRAALNAAPAAEDELDALEADALGDWERDIDPILEPLREAVDGARDYDDLVARLPDLLPAMNLQHLADKLAASGFKARAEGDVNQARRR